MSKKNIKYDEYFLNHPSFSNTNKKSIFIAGHQKLGDQICTISLVRFFAKYYDNVYLLTTLYKSYVSIFYSNLQNVHLIDHSEIKNATYDKELILGLNKIENKYIYLDKLPLNWYIESELDVNIMWDFFYIPNLYNNIESNNLYDLLENKEYVLTNTLSGTGLIFNPVNEFDILNNPKIFIDININLYPPDHKYHELCNKFINKNILAYTKLIQEANLILLTDSALFCLVLHIENIKTNKIILYSRDNRSYEHLFKQKEYLKLLFEVRVIF
jgi:hypothetical protein